MPCGLGVGLLVSEPSHFMGVAADYHIQMNLGFPSVNPIIILLFLTEAAE